MQLVDDVELVGDEFFADGERVGAIERFVDGFLRGGPDGSDPGVGGVGEVGVFGVVDGVDEPLASFPVEGGTLPDVIFAQELDDGGFAGGIVGGEEFAYGLGLSGDVFGLVGGAGFEDADEVLEGALAGGDGFRGADGIGDMAFEDDALLFGFVGDGEVGFAGTPD